MKFFKNLMKKDNKKLETIDVQYIGKDINEVISRIKSELGNCSDLVVNISHTGNNKDFKYASMYIDNLVNLNIINSLSLELTETLKANQTNQYNSADSFFEMSLNRLTGFRKSTVGSDYGTFYQHLLSGDTIFLIDGCERFFAINTNEYHGRAVEEPTVQTVVRGPKDAFTEIIIVNIALVRKRIKNKALRVENLNIGSVTNTQVTLMYIDKIAKDNIVEEIKRRLGQIEIDSILDSGYIEQLIKDDRYSIFPTILYSEKPDSVSAALLEGKISIMVDGSAYVLTAPAFFWDFIQASEDFYENFIISSILRFLRYITLNLTLFIPGIYVALTTFHQEMIPTSLVISIAAQREGVPFSSLVEVLLMETTFEILREAGIRMPRAIGPAISIVGALVLGQAAVEAGIVSAAVVIIVSFTAICSFVIPNYSMANAVRILRFVMIILAGMFGFYGMFIGLITLTLHLCKLKSIGIPYLTPIAPEIKGKTKDTYFRPPLWEMVFRPAGISDAKTPRIVDKSPVNQKQKEEPEFRR